MDERRVNRPGPRGTTVPVRIDGRGIDGPTPAQARSKRWRRTSHGRYVPTSVDAARVEQRIVEAAQVVPAYGGLTGWAALCWAGGRWFRNDRRPVPVATVRWIRSQPGISLVEERLAPADLTVVDGLPMTTLPRAACFEARYAPDLRAAVVALDMAADGDVCSLLEAAAYASTLSGWTGIPQCRTALALADENSWSPTETLMRLHWVLDAELPRPLCNQPVFDRWGRHVATPDLLDLEAGVVGEYDGAAHLAGAQRARDLRREHELRRLGLEYVTMVAADHADPLATIVPRMIETRSRARFQAIAARPWTVEPPRWWRVTSTVEERRALTLEERARLLAYRAA